MITANISLPEKLKNQAQSLIKQGYYASLSDLIRDSLRRLFTTVKYDVWAQQAKTDEVSGKAKVLKNKKDIEQYIKSL